MKRFIGTLYVNNIRWIFCDISLSNKINTFHLPMHPIFKAYSFFSPINLRKVESQLMFLQTTHLLSTYEIGFMQEAPR